jgi:hypothetical protein
VVWFSLAAKQVLDRVLDLFSFSIFVGLGVIALSFFQSPIFLQLVIFLLPPPGSVFSWSGRFCSLRVGCAGSWLTRSHFLGFVYRPRAQGSILGSTGFFIPALPFSLSLRSGHFFGDFSFLPVFNPLVLGTALAT